jgi:hypothetical protein
MPIFFVNRQNLKLDKFLNEASYTLPDKSFSERQKKGKQNRNKAPKENSRFEKRAKTDLTAC